MSKRKPKKRKLRPEPPFVVPRSVPQPDQLPRSR